MNRHCFLLALTSAIHPALCNEDEIVSLLQVHADRADRQTNDAPWFQELLKHAKDTVSGTKATEVNEKATESADVAEVLTNVMTDASGTALPSLPSSEAPQKGPLKRVAEKVKSVHKRATERFASKSTGKAEKPIMQPILQKDVSSATSSLASSSTVASSAAAQDIALELGKLRDTLTEQQQLEEKAKLKTKHEYDETLSTQVHEIKGLTVSNANLTADVAALEHGNEKLRSQADDLQKACTKIRTDLKGLQEKLAVAQEFANETLERADDTSAPELEVLETLAKEEKARESVKAHKHELETVGQLSMLSLGSSVPVAAAAPEQADLLKALGSSLETIDTVRVESEESLKASFLKIYEDNVSKLDELNSERKTLEHEKEEKAELRSRLLSAGGVLADTYKKLLTKKQQAVAFWHRLGEGLA